MLTTSAFIFFMVVLLIGGLLERYINRTVFPFSLALVILGFVTSEFATGILHINIGIHWENFQPLINHVIIPVLIFHAALMADMEIWRKNWFLIFLLSVPLMLLTTVIIGFGLYYAVGHPSGFPWIAALLTGVVLSATEPPAILSVLKKYNASRRLIVMLEGEGLFNDAMAVVLFSLLIGIAVTGTEIDNFWFVTLLDFIKTFLGGILLGSIIGFLGYLIIRSYTDSYMNILVTIISAYLSLFIAKDYLNVSGVMAVLGTAVTLRLLQEKIPASESKTDIKSFWNFIGTLADHLVFILAGVTVTLSMFSEQWIAMVYGIVIALTARIISINGIFPIINLFRQDKISTREQWLLSASGIRGTVTLALVLSLPVSLDYWYTIQSIAYGVVLFTLTVPTISLSIGFKAKILNEN